MTAMAELPSSTTKETKARPDPSWRKHEEHVVPKNRMSIVFFGLMCTVFLAALDQTIVATALPTIVAELGGGKNYSWVGSAYMLACASLGPLYGKLSNILGRKPMLYGCILIFLTTVGTTLLIIGGINEIFTKRSPIIPPRLFKTRTTGLTLISVFLHAVVFFAGSYYLPMYYQVLGASATSSGVRMLPYSLSSSAMAVVAGIFVTRTGSYRPTMWFGWTVMTLGFGLMIMLDNTTTNAEKEIYPLIASIGIGCLFQTPLIAIQAAMPIKDTATSTGAFMFLRTLGSTVGITIGEAIISSVLPQKLRGIQGLTFDTSAAALNDSIRRISSISNPTVRNEVMHAYSRSISTIWLVSTPLSAIGLFLVLFIRDYTLKRTIIRGGEKKLGDAERGAEQAKFAEDSQATELESLEHEKRQTSFDHATDSTDDIGKQKTEA